MRLQVGAKAPYAPGQVIVDLVRRQRQSGNVRVVDDSYLERLGVSESLRPRTLASLKVLGLIDDSGSITAVMDKVRLGSDADYKELLASHLRDVYGEVFDVVGDLATASAERIETAFRGFEPSGQRPRMVILFSALCQEAGLLADTASRERRATAGSPRPTKASSSRSSKAAETKQVGHPPMTVGEQSTPEVLLSASDPLLTAYFSRLPPGGSTMSPGARQKYLNALAGIFDLVYESVDEE